jgi:maltose O-acetyltransferase
MSPSRLATVRRRLNDMPLVGSGGQVRELVRRPLIRIRGDLRQDVLRERGLRLGERVFIGERTRFDGGFLWLISVGDDTTISAGVDILAHDGATRSAMGHTRIAPVRIGSGVYIGARAVILPGVTIGDRAIVGAGSVVRKDVAAGTIVAGNPAQVVGQVADFAERHRRAYAERPQYAPEGWTYGTGITSARQQRMIDELAGGSGYIG